MVYCPVIPISLRLAVLLLPKNVMVFSTVSVCVDKVVPFPPKLILPTMFTLPPTYKLPLTPTPPSTRRAPVTVLVLVVGIIISIPAGLPTLSVPMMRIRSVPATNPSVENTMSLCAPLSSVDKNILPLAVVPCGALMNM